MGKLALSTLILCLASATAFAHGSSYREYRPPGPPGPPPDSLRPTMPARNSSPPPPLPPPSPVSSFVWWSLNKEEILYPSSAVTAERDRPAEAADSRIREVVLPAMLAALQGKLGCPAKARILLALGSVGSGVRGLPEGTAERLCSLVVDGEQQIVVRTAAAMALGTLQTRGGLAVATLCDALSESTTHPDIRGAAALALGLLRLEPGDPGYDEAFRQLRYAAEDLESETVAACALLAMGLSRDWGHMPQLLNLSATGEWHSDVLRAHALSAIGKIAEVRPRIVTAEVIGALAGAASRGGPRTITSVAIACGQMGEHPDLDHRTRKKLVALLAGVLEGRDGTERDHALVSFGRIGAATANYADRLGIRIMLLREAREGSKRSREFSALGLGLLGRSPHLTTAEGRDLRGALLHEFLAVERDRLEVFSQAAGMPLAERVRAAKIMRSLAHPNTFAIAVGMAGATEEVPTLLAATEDPDRRRSGYAIALGMIGDPQALPVVEAALGTAQVEGFLVYGSLAAGLLGRGAALDALLSRIENRKARLFRGGTIIRAIGKLGDRRALPLLLELLGDESLSGDLRSVAAIAIADLFDSESSLILTRLTKDLNYPARVGTVDRILGSF